MIISFVFFFGAALVLSLLLTYQVRTWAHRIGALDSPDGERRLHGVAIPNVGGVAIFASAMTVLALGILFDLQFLQEPSDQVDQLITLILGGTAVFVLGLWDDVRELPAGGKFAIEGLIAATVFLAGIRIGAIGLPEVGLLELPTWLSFGVTVLWIVGITNAFNLIDGSDGIAAGAALFALSTMGIISILTGNNLAGFLCLVLAAATLGFLFFNFPPASIFLGDSGSLFLGFSLAALGIISTQEAPTTVAVAIPLIAFGLPILDTVVAIFRRFLRRRPVYMPDRGHIHHRLRDLGHSPRDVALLLYGACGFFSLLALLVVDGTAGGPAVGLILIVAGAILFLGIQRLDIPEFQEVGRVVRRGLRQRRVIALNVRIREAITHLRKLHEKEEIFIPLRYAFSESEFVRIELWVPREFASALGKQSDVEASGSGFCWNWETNGPSNGEPLFEVRLPLSDGNSSAGRLSLWMSTRDTYMLTDLQLIAKELLPALEGALASFYSAEPHSPATAQRERTSDRISV